MCLILRVFCSVGVFMSLIAMNRGRIWCGSSTIRLCPGFLLSTSRGCPSRVHRIARRSTEDAINDTKGVDTLLERDFKKVDLDAIGAAFEEEDTLNEKKNGSQEENAGKKEKNGFVKAKDGRWKKCGDAIADGLDLFKQGHYELALEAFEESLELPGNGVMRLSGGVKEYSCPSEKEEQAALYNMSCCYAKLGKKAAALTCIEALMESGFEDYDSLQHDPDLALIQNSEELNSIIGKHTGLFARLIKRNSKREEKKPWIGW